MMIDTVNKLPISLTQNAVQEILHLYKNGNYEAGFGLRIGLKGGGCAGFSYVLEFDAQKENDNVYSINSIPLYVDKLQELYLLDCEIDFKGGLDNRGFIFNNPNATSTCGCGTSFSA